MPLTHCDLFAGIGAFSLAAHQLGIKTTDAVEIGEYQQSILRKHYPWVRIHSDIRDFDATGKRWNIITGGSPCQNLSSAGRREGISGDRSSLFFEMLRVIAEARPNFVIWENVEGSINRGLRTVLASLRLVGYTWEPPQILAAALVGAPHLRKRVFLIAYPSELQQRFCQAEAWSDQIRREVAAIANADRQRREGQNSVQERAWTGGHSEIAANPIGCIHQWQRAEGRQTGTEFSLNSEVAADTRGGWLQGEESSSQEGTANSNISSYSATSEARPSSQSRSPVVDDGLPSWLSGYDHAGWWQENPAPSECGVPRGSYPNRYAELAAIGNSIVPQVATLALKRVLYLNEQLYANSY